MPAVTPRPGRYLIEPHSVALVALVAAPLRAIIAEASLGADFTVSTSVRGRSAQNAAAAQGNSQARFGQSAHNYKPAVGVDLMPWPFLGWKNINQFRELAHVMLAAAHAKRILLRWGGDWDMDGSEADEHGLRDFGHFELHPWRAAVKANKSVLAP